MNEIRTALLSLQAASRGGWLREQREKQGIGLREFSRATGLNPSYISMLETGSLEAPSPEMLDKIADGLDIESGKLHIIFGYLPQAVAAKIDKDPERAGELLEVLLDLDW